MALHVQKPAIDAASLLRGQTLPFGWGHREDVSLDLVQPRTRQRHRAAADGLAGGAREGFVQGILQKWWGWQGSNLRPLVS